MNTKKKTRPIIGILCFLMALFITSCVDGYKDDYTFSSDVRNTQLLSPDGSKVTATAVANITGGQDLKIVWPVVYGAGGYQFTLYNVDDPDNPIVVGVENEVIDGCSVTRERADDTKYKIVIKTLGNTELNNKEATEPTEVEYSTLIPVYASIPSGTDLGVYFENNPVQPQEGDATEIVYELEANGEYTMGSNVALKSTNITLRGDKVYRPKVKVTGDASFISDGAGFKIRWTDFDLNDYSGVGFIQYNTTIDETHAIFYNGDPWIVVEASSGMESCNVSNLKTSLISDRGKKYALRNFTFNDCVVEQHATSSNPFINFTGAIIKELSMINSTFYNKNKSYGSTWIVYANVRVVQVADRVVWASEKGSINIQNCTFWQVAYGKQFFNSNGWAQTSNSVNVQKSIFVDSGNKEVLRRIRMSSNNVAATFNLNTYWYGGALAENEITHNQGDKSGTHIASDPKLADPANGNFTVGGAAQISSATGDPRWLTAQ